MDYDTFISLIYETPYYKKYLDIMATSFEKCILYGEAVGKRWARDEMERVFSKETLEEIVRIKKKGGGEHLKRNGNIELDENT